MPRAKSTSKQIPGAGATPEPARVEGIKVRAIEVGYYDLKRRRVDDVFVIDGETYPADVPMTNAKGEVVGVRFHKGDVKAFSERWMERVDASTPERTTSAPEALKKAQDAITGDKGGGPTGAESVI